MGGGECLGEKGAVPFIRTSFESLKEMIQVDTEVHATCWKR